jgi:hypothetical protein
MPSKSRTPLLLGCLIPLVLLLIVGLGAFLGPKWFAGAYLGHTSANNEATGQVKKVVHNTPMFCPDTVDVDMSLGVIRNGVGSASKEDIWLQVHDPALITLLEAAAKTGAIVTLKYDVARYTICWKDHLVSSAALVQDASPASP